MTNECAICYVGDLNFMLPTLISAIGVRRFVPVHKADIYIFAVDDDATRVYKIDVFLKPYGIHVVQMSSKSFTGIDWARSNKTHVPLATLGRFFMDGLLPNPCKRIVYLDGDTWIKRDPTALIEMNMPDGKFAAAEDNCFFSRRDITPHGRSVRNYFRGLGIERGNGYFNAGVFAVRRDTWRTVAAEALDFFKKNIEACKYHDQSALNAVVGERRLRLSLAWNFQTPYRDWDVEKGVEPTIYHFSRGPKPWTGPVEPWAELFPVYENKIASLASLGLPTKRLTKAEIAAANAWSLRQRKKLRYILPLRLWARKKMLRKLASSSIL
jgi:lipopolysaccharide biosynthesis glycosyltransferase